MADASALTNLFTGPAGFWSFGGALLQPIFAGGRIRSGVKLARANADETVSVNQQSLQQAFREVSDTLVAYQKNQEFRAQRPAYPGCTGCEDTLASRYQGGVNSYLEVLVSDTRYLSAQLTLAQAELNERLAVVQLYGALGGGWQQ